MTEILRPDLCVIGGGPGGSAAACAAARKGVSVVLVEKRPLGGTDQLQQVWQTPLLVAAGARAAAGRTASRFGLPDAEPKIDLKRLHRESEAAIGRLARQDAPVRLAALNIRLVQDAGHFTGPRRFVAGEVTIEAGKFLLAVGSFAAPPAIAGRELVRPLTPDRLIELAAMPKRLAVIGADPEHLALAQAFQRLGSKVILLQSGEFLAGHDWELAAPLFHSLRQDGVEILTGAAIRRIEVASGPASGFRLVLADGAPIDATHLLYAGERLPLVEGLGLKAAHVAYGKDGIKLNADGRSSNPRIYAIADASHSLASLNAARLDGEWIVERLFGPASIRHQTAKVVPTDPEIATIGLSEAAAKARRRKVRVLRAGFCDNLRALSGSQPGRYPVAGHVKIITDLRGQLLGAGVVGPAARELIGVFGLALAGGLNVRDLASLGADEPALMEIWRTAALASDPQTGKAALGWKFSLRDFTRRR